MGSNAFLVPGLKNEESAEHMLRDIRGKPPPRNRCSGVPLRGRNLGLVPLVEHLINIVIFMVLEVILTQQYILLLVI